MEMELFLRVNIEPRTELYKKSQKSLLGLDFLYNSVCGESRDPQEALLPAGERGGASCERGGVSKNERNTLRAR